MELKVGHFYRNRIGDRVVIFQEDTKRGQFIGNGLRRFQPDGLTIPAQRLRSTAMDLVEEISVLEIEQCQSEIFHPEVQEDVSALIYLKGRSACNFLNPRLGPHENRELGLMRIGVKQLAYMGGLCWDHHCDQICELYGWTATRYGQSTNRLVTTPGEEWRATEFFRLGSIPVSERTDEFHYQSGDLLGYRVEDVTHYLERIKRLRSFDIPKVQ